MSPLTSSLLPRALTFVPSTIIHRPCYRWCLSPLASLVPITSPFTIPGARVGSSGIGGSGGSGSGSDGGSGGSGGGNDSDSDSGSCGIGNGSGRGRGSGIGSGGGSGGSGSGSGNGSGGGSGIGSGGGSGDSGRDDGGGCGGGSGIGSGGSSDINNISKSSKHIKPIFLTTLLNKPLYSSSIIHHPSSTARSWQGPVEVLDHRDSSKPNGLSILLTCEHATSYLPPPYSWSANDSTHFRNTHWSYDPGAADLTRSLAKSLGCVAILSTHSRLLIDPNRPLGSETLIRKQGDGRAIELNQHLGEEDIEWRLWRYYIPYHMTLGKLANALDPLIILSIHSFNPIYEDQPRPFQIGVLSTLHHTDPNNIATYIIDKLHKQHKLSCRLNEPWSGSEGYMYSADSVRIAEPLRRHVAMIEVRNDLLVNSSFKQQFSNDFVGIIRELLVMIQVKLGVYTEKE